MAKGSFGFSCRSLGQKLKGALSATLLSQRLKSQQQVAGARQNSEPPLLNSFLFDDELDAELSE
jgi:hypothetical protein